MTKAKKFISRYAENFMKYRFLLKELIRKSVKLQYRNSVLGVFWTLLQPLLTMIVVSVVFSGIFGRDSGQVVNYCVYLLTGRLLWSFFTQSTKNAMRSIRTNASIIKKVYVPKYIYPLSGILSTFVTFLISLIDLVIVIGFFNLLDKDPVHLTWRIIGFVIPVILVMFVSMGVGMILATLDVFFRDIEYLYEVFTLMLFYATPIFYTIDRLNISSPIILRLLKLNPMYGIIEMGRAFVLFGDNFAAHWSWNMFIYCVAFAIVINIIGFALFYKKQDKFILHI